MRRQALLIVAPVMVYLSGVDVQSQVAKQSPPQIGVSPQAAADPTIDDRRVQENTNALLTTTGTTLGRQTPHGKTDPLEGHWDNCPLSSCCAGILTQSFSMEIAPGAGVACAAADNTTPNAWARCFTLEEEGWAGLLSVTSIAFGIDTVLSDFEVPVNVNLYLDLDGCPPSGFGTPNALLIASAATVVTPADAGVLLEVEIDAEVPAGSSLIVEVESPLDGTVEPFFGLWPGANALGQCDHTYIRSADCGLTDWFQGLDSDFWFHLVLRVNAFGACLGEGLNCPTDVDGDGNTGPFDLATLLGGWGPTFPGNCFDANGDSVIGPFDLASLLAAWGPCP